MTDDSRARRLILYGVCVLLGGVLLVWTMFLIRRVLIILYISGLLAVGVSPAVRWLERKLSNRRRRVPRWAAILVLYVGIMGVLAGIIALLIDPLVAQLLELWTDLPKHVDTLQRTLVRHKLITHRYTWSELLRNLPNPGMALGGVVGAVRGAIGIAAAITLVLILPYYFLLEAQELQRGFLRLFSSERRAQVARISRDVTVTVGAWLSGQLLLAFIIGSTAALGFWLIGVPYFYVLALLAGVGELIPVIGPIVAAIPAVLLGFTVSVETGLMVVAYSSTQQFLENHFIVPRVMKQQVGLSSATVIAALLIGTELLGFIGAILAVPTAAIIQVLLQERLSGDTRT